MGKSKPRIKPAITGNDSDKGAYTGIISKLSLRHNTVTAPPATLPTTDTMSVTDTHSVIVTATRSNAKISNITPIDNTNVGKVAVGFAKDKDINGIPAVANLSSESSKVKESLPRSRMKVLGSSSGHVSPHVKDVPMTPVKDRSLLHDDILSSQAEPMYEVGWEWNSPSTQGADKVAKSNIADVMKILKDSEQTSKVTLASDTPPLLGLWMASPVSHTQHIQHKHISRNNDRPRRCRQSRCTDVQMDTNCNALLQSLQKLADVMEPRHDSPIPTHDGAANQSTEELWTDEELFENDSFLRQTQRLFDGGAGADNFASPKLPKRPYSTSTPVTARKSARYTFSLEPTSRRHLTTDNSFSPPVTVCATVTSDARQSNFPHAKRGICKPLTVLQTSCAVSKNTNATTSTTVAVQSNLTPYSTVKPVPPSVVQSTNDNVMMETSISDDLLARFAEPDEVLESQACLFDTSPQPAAPIACTLFTDSDDDDDALSERQLLQMLEEAESQATSIPPPTTTTQTSTSVKPLTNCSPLTERTRENKEQSTVMLANPEGDKMDVSEPCTQTSHRCSQEEIARKKEEALRRKRTRLSKRVN